MDPDEVTLFLSESLAGRYRPSTHLASALSPAPSSRRTTNQKLRSRRRSSSSPSVGSRRQDASSRTRSSYCASSAAVTA